MDRWCATPAASTARVPAQAAKVVGSSGSSASGIAKTHAPAAKSAYAATGSSPRSSRSSYAVRPGSTASQVASRESGPLLRANAAARNGPASRASRHCSRPASPGHQSRHTWVDAVCRIIRRPAGPIRSKWRCIPAYRGLESCRGTSSGERGSTGSASSSTPARAQSSRSSADRAPTSSAARPGTDEKQGRLSSTWPPGSNPVQRSYGAPAIARRTRSIGTADPSTASRVRSSCSTADTERPGGAPAGEEGRDTSAEEGIVHVGLLIR